MADARELCWDRADLARRLTSPGAWEPGRLADALALAVADHLGELRRPAPDSVRTTIHRPDPSRDEIRVPHLVLVSGTVVIELAAAGAEVLLDELPWRLSRPAADRVAGDTIVWEVMPLDTSAAWLGTIPSANLRTFVDANTHRLLALDQHPARIVRRPAPPPLADRGREPAIQTGHRREIGQQPRPCARRHPGRQRSL